MINFRTYSMEKQRFRILMICGALILLMHYPLLNLADKGGTAGGVPVLLIFIFTVWALAIVLYYFLSKNSGKRNRYE